MSFYLTNIIGKEKKVNKCLYTFYLSVNHSFVSDSLSDPWTAACQASLSMGFPRQNTRVGCHFLL